MAAESPTERQVVDYLRRNPDFLVNNTDLLKDLTPPAKWTGEGVVDMQQFVLQQLRGEIDNLRETASDVIETSRTNMSVQTRTHAAVLALLSASDFHELLGVVVDDLPLLLDVDASVLAFEPSAEPIDMLRSPDIGKLPEGTVDALVDPDRDVTLVNNLKDEGVVFGGSNAPIRSAAFARLYPGAGTPAGLFALGSRDAEAFHPQQGAELLGFMARVCERCVHIWLDRSS